MLISSALQVKAPSKEQTGYGHYRLLVSHEAFFNGPLYEVHLVILVLRVH